MSETATAHQEWDRLWQTESGRSDWLVPDPEVVRFTETLNKVGDLKALDLGCGIGRHGVHLAQSGFETYALDGSAAGLAYARKVASDRHLTIQFTEGSMERLPYETAFFDYVLAFNVIYHGDETVVARCLQEIHRVLKPGGFFQGTMLSKRNGQYGRGREIAPNTFVIFNEGNSPSPKDEDKDGDKDHPHFYCNARELCQLLQGFELCSLSDRMQKKPDSWHWYLVAERL
ncbi:MAG: class I SAM-dependent methyltransferase [Spirulina sp.]